MKTIQENPALCETPINQAFLFTQLEQPDNIALHAIEQGLETGLDINVINEEGETLLTKSIELNKVHLVLYLLDKGANPNFCGHNAYPPLVRATFHNLEHITTALLNHPQIDVNQRQKNQVTALAMASELGHEAIFEQLLDFEQLEMIEIVDDEEKISILNIAIKMKQVKIATKLIHRFPEPVNQPNKNGHYPLHFAAAVGVVDLIPLLLAHTNLDHCIDKGFTPLHAALDKEQPQAASLLVVPKWVNLSGENGVTALHLAAQAGYEDLVKILITTGTTARACEGCTVTPLIIAIINRYEKVASLLIDAFPEWVNQSADNISPLIHAIGRGMVNTVVQLVKKNAKVNNEYTALTFALCVKEIIDKSNKDFIPLLIQQCPELVNQRAKRGGSALCHAAKNGLPDFVELLLSFEHETSALKRSLNTAISSWIYSKEPIKQKHYRCSELIKEKLGHRLDKEEPKLEESSEQPWDWCFQYLYSTPPTLCDKIFLNKEEALRFTITSSLELLLKPQACIPYLLEFSKKLEQAWAKEYPDVPWVSFESNTIDLWSHENLSYPIPNDKFQKGIKKHSLLERLLVTEFHKHGMGAFQYKWTGYVDKQRSIELLSNNPIFKENGRTINGLLHGNVHNLQRLIILEAMKTGAISAPYWENGETKTLEAKEVLSALMRKDIGFKKPHAPLWQKLFDSMPFSNKASFTLPLILHSMILTNENLAGFLQDYMRFSFCNKVLQAHELFNTMCNKEHSMDEFFKVVKKLQLLLFTVSPEEAIKLEKKKAQDRNAEFESDKDEKTWAVVTKHYKPLFFDRVESMGCEELHSSFNCSSGS